MQYFQKLMSLQQQETDRKKLSQVIGFFFGKVVIPLIFSNVPQSSLGITLGFPSCPLPGPVIGRELQNLKVERPQKVAS